MEPLLALEGSDPDRIARLRGLFHDYHNELRHTATLSLPSP